MGAGIAQWFTQTGANVELADQNQKTLDQAKLQVFTSWDKLEKKGKFTAEQITCFKNNFKLCGPSDFNKQADLCLEVIIENLEIKTTVFQSLDQHFSSKTILASNTSSLSIDALAATLSDKRRKNFVGLHFFNPAPIMKLVEVISGHFSDPALVSNLYDWFARQGKKPAKCQDGPGFIVNRVARNFYGEPFRIIKKEDERAIKEVDQVMKEVGGFRMGPFELMDLIGIDINYSVSESVWKSFYHAARFAPHAIQRKMVQSNRLGKKTKQGFYPYE